MQFLYTQHRLSGGWVGALAPSTTLLSHLSNPSRPSIPLFTALLSFSFMCALPIPWCSVVLRVHWPRASRFRFKTSLDKHAKCVHLADCPHLLRRKAKSYHLYKMHRLLPHSPNFLTFVAKGWIDVHVMCTWSGAGPSDLPNFRVRRFGARIPTCVSLPLLL